MTRSVKDAAILLSTIIAVDPNDAAMHDNERKAYTDYTSFLDVNGLRGARIGVPRFYYQHLDEARAAVIERAINVCREQGAIIIDPVSLPCESAKWDWDVMRHEFKKN